MHWWDLLSDVFGGDYLSHTEVLKSGACSGPVLLTWRRLPSWLSNLPIKLLGILLNLIVSGVIRPSFAGGSLCRSLGLLLGLGVVWFVRLLLLLFLSPAGESLVWFCVVLSFLWSKVLHLIKNKIKIRGLREWFGLVLFWALDMWYLCSKMHVKSTAQGKSLGARHLLCTVF
jgi:hypothetical protein